MKRKTAHFLFLLLCILVQVSFSQDSEPFSINESPLPAPTSPVMDYAGVLDTATQKSLEDKIINFKNETNPPVELAVAIVKTTGDRPIFDYSLAVARGWGIGSREDDNPGALLLIAIEDRKYFTQVSRNLEDELPDGLVGSLQRQFLVPEFKKGNYGQGVADTIDAYIRTIKAKQSGEPLPESPAAPKYERDIVDRAFDAIPNWLCRTICLLVFILVIISIISGGKGGGGGGGGGGRRRGGRRNDSDVVGDIVGGILTGLILGGSSGGGSSSGGWSSGGGSSWGGSSGGSSWGGFGGGGVFGGGGAGGGW